MSFVPFIKEMGQTKTKIRSNYKEISVLATLLKKR